MISLRTVGIVVVLVLAFGGWVYLTRPEHKYRLSVHVETPDGVKSASGVFAVHLSKDPPLLPGVGSVGVRGDAVFVDLGNERKLFVTLSRGDGPQPNDGGVYLAQDAFTAAGSSASFKELGKLTGTVPITGTLIPTLVTFPDVNDPKTARIVRPDDLQSAFGAGYRLQGLSLTLVPVGLYPVDLGGPFGEPVTRGIDGQLPWIGTVAGYLSGRASCNPQKESCLQAVHFRRG